MKISKELQEYLDKDMLTAAEIRKARELLPSYKYSSTIYAEMKKEVEDTFVGTLSEINKKLVAIKQEAEEISHKGYIERNKLSDLLEEKFKNYLSNSNSLLSKKQAEIVWDKAYIDGHPSGYENIEWHFNELADFYEKMVNAK